jgi:hypothetical protein
LRAPARAPSSEPVSAKPTIDTATPRGGDEIVPAVVVLDLPEQLVVERALLFTLYAFQRSSSVR